jgi:S-adenosylmethionine synthetase
MNGTYLFSSESVTEGHPDKVADAISDGVLDALIAEDKNCRVACETLVTTGMAVIAGEITTSAYAHMPDIVRNTIKRIGYDDPDMGFDWETCAVITSIDKQSPDISMGVTKGKGLFSKQEQGAGDQGIMFGFACRETPELMPSPILYAHKVTKRLAEVRHKKVLDFLRPDGKSQVTVQYEGNTPVRIDAVVIAAQHTPDVKYRTLKEAIIEEVVYKAIPRRLLDKKTRYFINATGRFVLGGPQADCGLTGRKIIVDSYGGWGHHGGGAFSGKDPSKVDRSASYMARYIAKNIVAAGIAGSCEVQLAYAIGVPDPVSVFVETFGTSKFSEEKIEKLIRRHFDMRPARIIEYLDLKRPIYSKTAAYGHFGRNEPEFTWERCDKAAALKSDAGNKG